MCTALAPVIGYDKAAKIAKKAHAEDKTLKTRQKGINILRKKKSVCRRLAILEASSG